MNTARLSRPARWLTLLFRPVWLCLLLAVLAGPETGCTRQEGTAVSASALSHIQERISTMSDVRHWLGKPDKIRALLGNQTWIYRHSVRRGWFSLRMKEREVRIRFSHAGIVRKITVLENHNSQLF
ncbi:MAG: outer membrane protein assembly factor BamE [Nitrospirae bacterium]|nr:outer membrane protein assembly factor BamE [Nitrospirota bacterium]